MLAAVILIAGSIYGYVKIQSSLNNSEVIAGTVITVKRPEINNRSNLRKEDYSKRSLSWVVTFSYAFDGKNYRQAYPTYYSEKEKPEIGTQVEIYVNRDNPERFLINEFKKLYSLEATLAFMAFVLLFIGLPMYFLLGSGSKAFPKPPNPPWPTDKQ